VGKDDRTLVLQDLEHETVLRRITSPQKDRPYLSASTITPGGSDVAAIWRAARSNPEAEPADIDPPVLIAVWEAGSGTLVRTITYPATATDLALSPDGRLLAVGDARGNIAIWNLPEGTPYATLSASDHRIQCLAFGREPRLHYSLKPDAPSWQLAVGDAGGDVTMFDLRSKRIRNIGRGSNYDIKAMEFNSDGTVLASTGRASVRLWDVATGRLLLDAEAGNVNLAVAFSPDGRSLAVGHMQAFSKKDGVSVFDLRSGRGMRSLFGLATKIQNVTFSRDGRYIAAQTQDWQVAIWDSASGHCRDGIRPRVSSVRVFGSRACHALGSRDRSPGADLEPPTRPQRSSGLSGPGPALPLPLRNEGSSRAVQLESSQGPSPSLSPL
jgi:WD40 repeat protein